MENTFTYHIQSHIYNKYNDVDFHKEAAEKITLEELTAVCREIDKTRTPLGRYDENGLINYFPRGIDILISSAIFKADEPVQVADFIDFSLLEGVSDLHTTLLNRFYDYNLFVFSRTFFNKLILGVDTKVKILNCYIIDDLYVSDILGEYHSGTIDLDYL